MIDTGLSCYKEKVMQIARDNNIKQVLLTHHHEDHSGNTSYLQQEGYTVYGGKETSMIMEHGFNIRFYEHII